MSFPNQPKPPGGQFPPPQNPYSGSYGSPASVQRRPPQKSSGGKTCLIVGLIGGVLGLICCAVCGGLVMWVQTLSTDSTETRMVKDAKTGASIQVPKNWDLSMSLNPIAEIQVGNEFADKYVMVIIEPKSDFPRGTSINSYANLVLRSMKMENPGLSRSDNKQLTINGKPATQFRLTGRVEGVNVVYWITVVRGARHFYQIVGWTSSRSESKNRESIMNVVNSFKGQ